MVTITILSNDHKGTEKSRRRIRKTKSCCWRRKEKVKKILRKFYWKKYKRLDAEAEKTRKEHEEKLRIAAEEENKL